VGLGEGAGSGGVQSLLTALTDHGHRCGGRADAGKRESITKWLSWLAGVKDLTHSSGVPNVAQLIAKKLFYYPVAETRLSACLFPVLYS
jgi:hypothetical protein